MDLALAVDQNLHDAAHPSIDGKRGIFATLDDFSRLACNQ
jgi:hypothetical protein